MISVAGALSAQGSQWIERSAGLPVSQAVVTGLSINPKGGGLFALTPFNGLFKSSDGGENWGLVRSITGVLSLAMKAENTSTIYATTDHGIFKTTNSGGSWTVADNGVTGFVRALVIDPDDSETLYAHTIDNGLFKTSDGAATWREVRTGLHDGNSYGVAIATAPGHTPTLYLAYGITNVLGSRISRSTDGGATWSAVSVLSSSSINSLSIDPASPSTIYATANFTTSNSHGFVVGGGILKSTDAGANWEVVSGLPQNDSISSFAIDPAAPSTLFATYKFGAGGGMLKSTDGGVSFAVIGTDVIPSLSRPTLAIDPATSTVYVAYYGQNGCGILKSQDGGSNWQEADGGLEYVDVSLMAVDPVNSSFVYSVAPVRPVNFRRSTVVTDYIGAMMEDLPGRA
jgi:photosystem II stability/assembly factor-like uncharacterized protein